MLEPETKLIPINSTLHELLVTKNMDNFTILELRDQFIELYNNSISTEQARQYVYRHLLRLQKLSFIEKHQPKAGNKPIYQKSENFKSIAWQTHDSLVLPKKGKTPKRSTEQTSKMPVNALVAKLQQAKNDFIACVEESKTYSSLVQQYPHMAYELKKHRSLAEEQSAKLVGEIRALKVTLGMYG
ncbi:hypothetical protein [Thaumasiovibrio sp. DFM-14]|uniref:hypothetical protein n=1 Tax=Thaumasiovibrio sp. DFM-14 TaxID=3384792 RepID=UPI0039A32CA4